MRKLRTVAFCAIVFYGLHASTQATIVSARVELVRAKDASRHGKNSSAANVLFWLTPVSPANTAGLAPKPSISPPRLTQHNKSFSPHLLVVPVGSLVEFPNRDPFFHNVFSLYEGKRFDLGLYEAGTTRTVRFDKPGISYIFCNIHAEMSAVVVALTTPYYGISNQQGEVIIPDVPAGRYLLHAWYETASSETLDAITHEITITENQSSIGVFRIPATGTRPSHKNKYGKNYDPPSPDNPAYNRP